jgi:hypothetical protein
MSKLKDDPVVSVINSSTVPAAQEGASGFASVLSEVVKAAKTKSSRPSKFVTSVLSVSDDRSRVKVKLCTGRVIDVPMSILKNVTFLGTASSGDESWGIAAGELDLSTDVGILIQQMAHEIIHLSRSLQTAQEGLLRSHATDANKPLVRAEESPATTPKTAETPFDNVLPEQIVKIPITALAGFPHAVVYAAPFSQYIQQWSVFNTVNCYLTQSPTIIETGGPAGRPAQILEIQFVVDAAHGTPLYTTYNAQLVLDLTLAQFTT